MSVTSTPSAVTPVLPVSSPVSVPLIITSTSNFTSDEKRNLLFDINRALEIPIDDFNDEWWPLVTNIWTKDGPEIDLAKIRNPKFRIRNPKFFRN